MSHNKLEMATYQRGLFFEEKLKLDGGVFYFHSSNPEKIALDEKRFLVSEFFPTDSIDHVRNRHAAAAFILSQKLIKQVWNNYIPYIKYSTQERRWLIESSLVRRAEERKIIACSIRHFGSLAGSNFCMSAGADEGGGYGSISPLTIANLFVPFLLTHGVLIKGKGKIFEIGCGDGKVGWTLALTLGCNVVNIEISRERVSAAARLGHLLLKNKTCRYVGPVHTYNAFLIHEDACLPAVWKNVKLIYMYDSM